MAYNLNPNEISFLQRFADHEDIQSISHLIRAITSGVDLTRDDLLSIEDYLMDRTAEIEGEGLEVPQFFEAIRNIVARLVNSSPVQQEASKTPTLPGVQSYPQQGFQGAPVPKKERKPRARPVSDEPRVSKKEKYKDADLTADNIPPYLREIHEIVNQVVEARCQEEIERRIAAEKKLEQLQKILGGL
jgi:hypothetical protein